MAYINGGYPRMNKKLDLLLKSFRDPDQLTLDHNTDESRLSLALRKKYPLIHNLIKNKYNGRDGDIEFANDFFHIRELPTEDTPKSKKELHENIYHILHGKGYLEGIEPKRKRLMDFHNAISKTQFQKSIETVDEHPIKYHLSPYKSIPGKEIHSIDYEPSNGIDHYYTARDKNKRILASGSIRQGIIDEEGNYRKEPQISLANVDTGRGKGKGKNVLKELFHKVHKEHTKIEHVSSLGGNEYLHRTLHKLKDEGVLTPEEQGASGNIIGWRYNHQFNKLHPDNEGNIKKSVFDSIKKSLFDDLSKSKDTKWYNATNKWHTNEDADKQISRLKKKSPGANFKKIVNPNNKSSYSILQEHVEEKRPSKFGRSIHVYNDEDGLTQLHGPEYHKDDTHYIFKEHPDKRYINHSDIDTDLFIDSKSKENLGTPWEKNFSPKIEAMKKELKQKGKKEYSEKMVGVNILNQMAADEDEQKEVMGIKKSMPDDDIVKENKRLEEKWDSALREQRGPNEITNKHMEKYLSHSKKHFPVILSKKVTNDNNDYGLIDYSNANGGWYDSNIFHKIVNGINVPNEIGEKIQIRPERSGGSAVNEFHPSPENFQIVKNNLEKHGYKVHIDEKINHKAPKLKALEPSKIKNEKGQLSLFKSIEKDYMKITEENFEEIKNLFIKNKKIKICQ